ncbi:PREDICTED: U-box domain-containing protein 17-like [Brassica oleracea var. oleracea]|uniref:RING-type E3 ubiquitin transferase n=1 Tax=Brassica oleracea var. oleracea TaxID=109376 RepID=A0A0D3BIU0_BRAOL|nr:PREDICTED: U-box domain-containing protein 17-like [Brassica oleracea var. oleracea]
MATAAIFSSLRRRRSPSLEAFLSPVDLSGLPLVQTLAAISTEIISSFSGTRFSFQRRNARSLIRKIEIFLVLFESLAESRWGSTPSSSSSSSSTALLCLKELYLLLYRSKILLDYCAHSSKLWLLLQTQSISGYFHDLNQEISTLLDVFPVNDLNLSDDVREQIELLQSQSRRSRLYIDNNDESLRRTFYSFLDGFEHGEIPNTLALRSFFVEKLGIKDSKSCRSEIEFLEEQIANHDGDVEPTGSVINGFVAITRYCRFLLFGFEEEWRIKNNNPKKKSKGDGNDGFITVPKDFVCPISLDLMTDPVIISTGQTYDRTSIARWIEEGHCTCPKTGQMLVDSRIVPNRALKNLIVQWCAASGDSYESEFVTDSPTNEGFVSGLPTKAAVEANKATVSILIEYLADGSEASQTVAAREIRLLAKTGKENREFIAEAGAIPHLRRLLKSENAVAQENSVTAMLNLSIYEKNKSRIMEEEDCLEAIVSVLVSGLTVEAQENAAATLFSLSAVHEYKKRIAMADQCVEALASLLQNGTPRGKKDAVTALYNLSTHPENCSRMIEGGGVSSLVGALKNEGVAEEAAGALALLVRQSLGAEAIGKEESAVTGLMWMMRCGTPRGKENAVAALLELCRRGGAAVAERVLRAPAIAGVLQTLLFTGTKRARRKAASLARVFQRREHAAMRAGGYGFVGDVNGNRDGGNFTTDVSVPMSISISVPVL